MTELIKSIDDLCFMDSETRRVANATVGDVTQVGGYLYNRNAFATMWTWAIGMEPVQIMALDEGFHEYLSWELDAPDSLKRFHDRVLAGKAWYAAWNMNFDRLQWNGPQSDFPEIRPEHTIDVMAQAAASGLPTKLAHAAKWIGATEKVEAGAHLIKLFEPPNGATPQSRPEDWALFREYGIVDTDALRGVYLRTRPLPREEWIQYWVSERINDRGMTLDTDFCAAVEAVVDRDRANMNARLTRLTDGVVTKVTQAKRILDWVKPILEDRSEAYAMLIDKKEVLYGKDEQHRAGDEDTEVKRHESLSLAREKLENVLAFYENLPVPTPRETVMVEVLTLRLFGGSNTPQKFSKARRMVDEGKLKGQYVFNGAAQTGRFSSRGVQVHNLTRAHLGDWEQEAIETLQDMGKAVAVANMTKDGAEV